MTNQKAYNFITNFDSKTSSNYVYDAKLDLNLPENAVVDMSEIYASKRFDFYHLNKNGFYSQRIFIMQEALYVNHLFNFRQTILQKLLDSGRLYLDVCRRMKRIDAAVMKLTDKMCDNDPSCQLALKLGDESTYYKYRKGIKLEAQSQVYATMLYI